MEDDANTHISAIRILDRLQTFIDTSLLEEEVDSMNMVRSACLHRPGCTEMREDRSVWVQSGMFSRRRVKPMKYPQNQQ